MLTRLRAVRASGEQGFTLAELLVGSSLAGIAGTIGTMLFVGVATQAGETTTQEQLGNDNRVALTQLASELQFADSPAAVPITADGRFEVFKADKITFYSNRETGSRSGSSSRTPPSRVTIERVADASTNTASLVMSVFAPLTKYGTSGKPYPSSYSYASNYPTTATQTMTLARGVGNDTSKSSEAIFTYCSSAPDPAPPSPSATATATPVAQCDAITPTGTAATDRLLANRISSVIIRLKVGGANYKTNNTKYQPATWLTTRVAISGAVDPTGGA